MGVLRNQIIFLATITLILQTQGADKYTDENRPYEFGFTIDGEQHRHEKKDENGIIMGEFGFITADGVYHVTVYATDENGNFHIVSMKNIRVKPYPAEEKGTRQGKANSVPFPSIQQTETPLEKSERQEPIPKLIASPAKSCSHCSIPTTTTIAPKLTNVAANDQNLLNNYNKKVQPGDSGATQVPIYPQQGPNYPPLGSGFNQNYPQPVNVGQSNIQGPEAGRNDAQQDPNAQQNYGQQYYNNEPQSPNAAKGNSPQVFANAQPNSQNAYNGQNYPQQSFAPQQNYPQADTNSNQNYPQNNNGFPNNSPEKSSYSDKNYDPRDYQQNIGQQGNDTPQSSVPEQSLRSGFPSDRTPKQYIETPFNEGTDNNNFEPPQNQPLPYKPVLISAQMQIVDKNTDIYHRGPGEQDGLPNGLTKDDMTRLLYTFNYTVGFHGHHEEGYSNGAKQGYYYVTGRNGIRTRVDYVADEKGFRPKISQEVLDLLSDDVPKPETEKEEKYGLKGYEFKWLYYPVEPNQK